MFQFLFTKIENPKIYRGISSQGLTELIESVLCRSIDDTMVCLNLKQSDVSGKTDNKKVKPSFAEMLRKGKERNKTKYSNSPFGEK